MASPTLLTYESWDHYPSDKVSAFNSYAPSFLTRWSGSVGSIVDSLSDNSGSAIQAPSNYRNQDFANNTYDTAIIRMLFRPDAVSSEKKIVSVNDGATVQTQLLINADGTLSIERGSTILGTSTEILSAGTVYDIEFGLHIDNTVGSTTVYVDGTEITGLTLTSTDTQNSGSKSTFSRIQFNNSDGTYDDYSLKGGTGVFDSTDFDTISTTVGSPKFITLYPNADGNYTAWEPDSGSGDDYTFINEKEGDSSTSRLESTITSDKQSWTYDAFPTGVDNILSVTTSNLISCRISGEKINHFFRIGGTDYEHSDSTASLTSTMKYDNRMWSTNPATSVAWVPKDLSAAEIGVVRSSGSNSDNVYISQGVLVVVYTTDVAKEVEEVVGEAASQIIVGGVAPGGDVNYNLSGSTVNVSEYTFVDSASALDSYVSRSSRWKTREGDVRRRLYKMTLAKNNISFVYRESLRGMIASFNDIGYIDSEDKFIDIRCIHANAERAIAKLKQENNIILPILSISQTVSDNDDERRRNESVLVHEKYWDADKQRAFRILSFAPRPVNVRYQLNIWCKYMADMDQILEQVRLKFNPELQIPTKYSTLAKAMIDSEENVGDLIAADKEDRVFKKTINITLRTYIPSPKFLVTSTGKIEEFKVEAYLPKKDQFI